ncbi:MAG TPA: flagellar basal-body MS-ring/collar protein FliF, partial [Dermatophilaceae bacterium]
MKNYANAAGQRALRTVTGFTTGQKTITALALLAVILGGSFFYKWAATPTYAPLFSNLSGTDASAIVDKLSADGTPYQLTDGGSTITVPQESVYAERIKMSGQGLPSGDTTGYALLDKQGLTTSQFQQTVDYQRAVEGELEKTINSIDGVRSAIVHLAIPQQSVFTSDTTKPTASVLISTQPGVSMTSQQVQSVTNLVSAAVPGMAANGVSVSDSTGRVLTSVGATGTTQGGAGDTRAQMTADFESRTTTQLQDMVDRLVGPGHAVVQVT